MHRATLASVAVLLLATWAVQARDDRVVQPFNGKDLTGWKFKGPAEKSKWQVGKAVLNANDPAKLAFTTGGDMAELVNVTGGGVDIYSEAQFGDCVIEVELMVPKGSNSGVYVMGEYEVQVLDSYGKEKFGMGDLGALYSAAVPRLNAAKKPGEWQKFVLDFQAPKFVDGKKNENAVFRKVTLNDQVIHENVAMKGPTPGGITGKEAPTGPIMFQGDHGPVSFRNLKITVK